MFLSILVLTKNESANIVRCLESVFSQNTSRKYEVVLVDSGSTDNTVELARKFPVRVVEIPAEQFHHARTRNYAAELAQGDVLVYLAADAFPASNGWLEALVSGFDDPSIAAVYGKQIPKPGSLAERRYALGALYGDSRVVKTPATKAHLGYRYYHFSTVNAAIAKRAWEQTRFPNELKVFEDIAIAKRILDRGWHIVYEPQACVYHSHDYPARILFQRYFDIGVVHQRLGFNDDLHRNSMKHEGWRILKQKLSLIREPDGVRQFAINSFYDFVKYSGIVLGRNQQVIPLGIKRRFSRFRLFDE